MSSGVPRPVPVLGPGGRTKLVMPQGCPIHVSKMHRTERGRTQKEGRVFFLLFPVCSVLIYTVDNIGSVVLVGFILESVVRADKSLSFSIVKSIT